MTDKREDILNRLLEIASEVEGAVSAERNNLNPSDRKLPAIIVLEGDEEPSPAVDVARHRPANVPVPVVMIPQLCILVGDEDIGTTLNTLRVRLIKAIATDATLIAMLGANGAIAYRGLQSDLGLGRTNLGRCALQFAITYMLVPNKL